MNMTTYNSWKFYQTNVWLNFTQKNVAKTIHNSFFSVHTPYNIHLFAFVRISNNFFYLSQSEIIAAKSKSEIDNSFYQLHRQRFSFWDNKIKVYVNLYQIVILRITIIPTEWKTHTFVCVNCQQHTIFTIANSHWSTLPCCQYHYFNIRILLQLFESSENLNKKPSTQKYYNLLFIY
jgi:hypothetical protein